MLAAVPGVTPRNLKNIVAEVGNVREVANMEKGELEKLVGGEAGRMMYGFFNRDVVMTAGGAEP